MRQKASLLEPLAPARGAFPVRRGHGRPVHRAGSLRDARRLRTEVGEGLHWLWHHRAVRTLALTIVSFNVTYGAARSVLVLYATRHLQMGEVGFGLLTR